MFVLRYIRRVILCRLQKSFSSLFSCTPGHSSGGLSFRFFIDVVNIVKNQLNRNILTLIQLEHKEIEIFGKLKKWSRNFSSIFKSFKVSSKCFNLVKTKVSSTIFRFEISKVIELYYFLLKVLVYFDMLFARFRAVTVCIWPHIHSKLRIIRRTGSERRLERLSRTQSRFL